VAGEAALQGRKGKEMGDGGGGYFGREEGGSGGFNGRSATRRLMG